MILPKEPTSTFPYRIFHKVGEGGMGMVYRAEEPDLGRPVAIKVLRPEQIGDGRGQAALGRFLQEARAAAALSHPGVTTVHRVGMEGGWPYIAMEWLEGRTLEELLAEEPHRFTLQQAIRIVLEVLAVLEVAHASGIVHRDIKPGNLMLVTSGRIKVTDFGIARVRGSDLADTQAGMIMGTPHYAAPEQLVGHPIDSRADLYAVGCVLYELIAGRRPFEATSIYELIHAVHETAPIPPSTGVRGVPPAIDDVVLKALAKRPDERFPTATAMSAALEPLLSVAALRRSGVVAAITPSVVPAPPTVPTVIVDGVGPIGLVAEVARAWPPTPLPGRQHARRLLDRLLERPLHAPAFCGMVEAARACLLIHDGIIYGAFEPASGRVGDVVIERLPDEVNATLHALPPGNDPRMIVLLASVLLAPKVRHAGLDAAVVDLAQLTAKLAAEGFDGAIRLARGAQLGFALFSRGRRILDVFGAGWPTSPATARWEAWIASSGATASVEPLRRAVPALTFRQQLRNLALEVVRPSQGTSSIRSDTVAEARALELRPRAGTAEALRRGESTLNALVLDDPAHAVARWALTELAPQFARFGRAGRWKALVEPLGRVSEVRLHPTLTLARGGAETFDVATYTHNGRIQHVIERVALGTRAVVERFVARAVAVKRGSGNEELGGAILFAPSFDDAALEGYLAALQAATRRSLMSGIDALAHREGYVRLGARSGFHVLLVEAADGKPPRPLVFE